MDNDNEIPRIYTTGFDSRSLNKEQPQPKCKAEKESLDQQIQDFFNKGKQVKQVDTQRRSMPEFVWYMDDYPKRRWYTKK